MILPGVLVVLVLQVKDKTFILKNLYYILSISALLFLLNSCGFTKKATSSKNIVLVSDTLSEAKRNDFTYAFFEANKYYLNGKTDMALSLYKNCLQIDPTSAAVYYQLAGIHMKAEQLQLAETFIDKALYYNSDNMWYHYLAANIYGKNNNEEKAVKSLNYLINDNPKVMDYYLALADVYIQSKNIKEAINVYSRIEQKFGRSELISLQKVNIYRSEGKYNEAINELYNLYNNTGHDIEIKRIIAEVYFQINDVDNCIRVYNEILNEKPHDGFAYIGLAECYSVKKDIEKSKDYLIKAFNDKEVSSEVKVNLIVNLFQLNQSDTIYNQTIKELIVISYKQFPENFDIKTLYADYLIKSDSITRAKEIIYEIVTERKNNYAIWEQLVLLENQAKNWDSCLMVSKEALKYFPNQNFLYFFKGFSEYSMEMYTDALETLEFGFKITRSDDPIRPDFISFLAEVNYKLNNKEQAYSYYDNYLESDNDNLMMLNNYAYYLSLDKKDLQKAEQMSLKTIQKEPKSSTYLDTYAWILFQMQNYSKALEYIKKAVDNNTENSEVIIEHYGDILFYNNDIDNAVIQWENAKQIGKGSGKLDEKIKLRQYVE